MTLKYINNYKISDKNLNTHKWGKKQNAGMGDWFVRCELCGLEVFRPDKNVKFYTTFDMNMDFSCDEMIIKNIIE